MGQEDGPGFSPSGPAWRHQAEPKEDRGLLENWDLSIEHRTGVQTPLVSSQNSGSPCTQAALSKNEVLLGLVDSFPPQSEALMVGTLSSAFPGLSKPQLPTDKVRVSKFTVSGLQPWRLGPRGRGPMPSLKSIPSCVLPPSCPLAFPHLPSPGEQVGGAWGRPGGQEHPSRLLPGAAAESPRGKRAGRSAGGRGPRDPSGRLRARLGAQRGRGRPRGSAGRQDPESSEAGGVWGLGCGL